MTNNTIKNHLLNTFRKYGFRPNHDQLERAITRYQCFGPRLLTTYMPNLARCYSRPDIWVFLEMAYPDAIFKADYLGILKDAVKEVPFGTVEYLIDDYRKQIFQPTYDMI